MTDPAACTACGSADLTQDQDVLDTWFSSWLWPFSTLGWPEETEDLRYWYPTDVLLTGYDIIFFWVSRMIMAGLHFRGEVPFTDVVLTGLVRDWEGKKMSKSLGNQIDPLDLIERYGTDAVRFTLARVAVPGQDMNLNEDWIEGSRHFCNKLWNASRFVIQNLEGFDPDATRGADGGGLPEAWIRSRFAQTRAAVHDALENYEFSEAARSLQQFLWSEYCDWYVEMAKLGLRDPARRWDVQATLFTVLESTLRLAHPIMPFITEEIWQRLPRRKGDAVSIMVAPWPQAISGLDAAAEDDMAFLQEIVVEIRRFRHEHGIAPQKRIDAVIDVQGEFAASVEAHAGELRALAWLSDVKVGPRPGDGWSKVVAGHAEVYLPLSELVDVGAERDRLRKEAGDAETNAGRVRAKLDNPSFVDKAPPDVVDKARRQLAEQEARIERLRAQLAELEG